MNPLRLYVEFPTPPDIPVARAFAALLLRTRLDIAIVHNPANADLRLGYGSPPHPGVLSLARAAHSPAKYKVHEDLRALMKQASSHREAPLQPWIREERGALCLRIDLPGLLGAVLDGCLEETAPDDQHGRPSFDATLAHELNLLDRPWLDEIAQAFGSLLRTAAGHKVPEMRPSWVFAPTFDIDSAGYFTGKSMLRRLAAEKSSVLPQKLWLGLRVKARIGRDPHLRLREIAEALEGREVPATFFLQVLRLAPLDNYDLARSSLLLAELRAVAKNRFHEIGLHSSYATRDHAGSMARQWKELRRCVGPALVPVHRAHYLRAPRGLAYEPSPWKSDTMDSSLAFGAREGFRRGTAMPWRAAENLIEMAPAVMDSTLIHHRHCDPAEATDRTLALMERVRRTGGVFVPIWHPHNMDAVSPDSWGGVLWDTVSEAKKRGAICQSLAHAARTLQHRADEWEKALLESRA